VISFVGNGCIIFLRPLLGDRIFLLNEQYIVKPSFSSESKFNYHQDSEYINGNEVPYVSCWISLDDTTEENGTLYFIPYPNQDTRLPVHIQSVEEYTNHHNTAAASYQGKLYYEQHMEDNLDNEIEIPLLVSAGSMIIISSKVLHRSSANISNARRRAFMPQYSSFPIYYPQPKQLVAFAVPLHED